MPLPDDTRLNPGPSTQSGGASSPTPAPAKPSRWPLWLAIALCVALLGTALVMQ